MAWLSPATEVQWLSAGVLLALALIAELRPVHFLREGVFMALSLPYLAGLLLIGGPLAALVGEVVVLLVATGIRRAHRKTGRELYWLGLNLPLVMIASSVGGLLWWSIGLIGAHWSLRTAAFIAGYLTLNFLMVSHVNSRIGAQNFSQQLVNGAQSVVIGFSVYLLVALGVGVLLRGEALWFVPLTFIPIELLRRIISEHKRLDDHAYETMVALTIMLQRAHPYTHGHLERVGRLAEEVGRKLGLPASRALLLRKAAVLHDIGKIAIDEEILDKPAKLTDEEYEHVKQHSAFGAEILSHSERFQAIVPWIRHHHERLDGRGYPHQLTDLEIPLESKVIAVSDAFDAMVGGASSSEKRNHREPMSIDEAVAELRRCSGTQFDPKVVQAFTDALQGGQR